MVAAVLCVMGIVVLLSEWASPGQWAGLAGVPSGRAGIRGGACCIPRSSRGQGGQGWGQGFPLSDPPLCLLGGKCKCRRAR